MTGHINNIKHQFFIIFLKNHGQQNNFCIDLSIIISK